MFVVWDTDTELSKISYTESVPESRDGRDSCMRSCCRSSVFAGGGADLAAAAVGRGRCPASVLRVLLPGDFPIPQPLYNPRLDGFIQSTDLYTGILPH
jgi:hypothetical protein